MKKPNVLIIHTDEHVSTFLGCMGNSKVQTPHIDKLAGEGVFFQNAYTCNGVCIPSRGTLLTGRYPIGHSVTCNERKLPESEVMMSERFNSPDCGDDTPVVPVPVLDGSEISMTAVWSSDADINRKQQHTTNMSMNGTSSGSSQTSRCLTFFLGANANSHHLLGVPRALRLAFELCQGVNYRHHAGVDIVVDAGNASLQQAVYDKRGDGDY